MEVKPTKQYLLRLDVLRCLYFSGGQSVTSISRSLGKSLPLVTSMVNRLLEDGLIESDRLAPSTGGRRASEYQLGSQNRRFIVAVAVDQFITRIIIYDWLNNPVNEAYELALRLENSRCILEELSSLITDYIDGSGIDKDKILGVGIAMPGFVNASLGVNYTFFGLGANSVSRFVEEEIGVPVFIDNDSSAIALAELYFGSARGFNDVMVVNAGWGIGLGMIVNGQLFRGHNGFAGEFSHMPLADSDSLCSCGKRGCLEVEASLKVLANKARLEIEQGTESLITTRFIGKVPRGEEILWAANQGDRLSISLLSKAGFIIGKGVAMLIHIMNPEGVVISGRGALASKTLLAPVHQAINEFCIPKLAEQTKVVASTMHRNAELIGAATLVMERIKNI